MKKMTLSDVKAYDAPGHFGVSTMRLHGQEETGASKFPFLARWWVRSWGSSRRKSLLCAGGGDNDKE